MFIFFDMSYGDTYAYKITKKYVHSLCYDVF